MSEAWVRVAVFLGVFVVMATWEHLAPRRPLTQDKGARWANNLGLIALNTLVLRLLFPAAAVGVAVWAGDHGLGLMHGAPAWLAVPASVVLLDLAIWAQHVAFHRVPLLWRLHRVHHADLDYDVTTGIRFHPVEMVLSMLIKAVVVVLLGAPAMAVFVFEVILNAMAMFNHGNVGLPVWLDHALRRVLVTPDMHRVHHSTLPQEHHTNFGFNLAVWDRWFGTSCDEPVGGQLGMEIGLADVRDTLTADRLAGMLSLPFRAR